MHPSGFIPGPPLRMRMNPDEDEVEDLPLEDEQEIELEPIIPHFSGRPQPFDPYMCDPEFWPPFPNDEEFSKALISRNQQITPNENEQAAVTSLMTRVKSALETIAASNLIPSVVSFLLKLFNKYLEN
jgi:hypothetical protein